MRPQGSSDEEQIIKAAIEERKQRARSLGIVKTVFTLYRNQIRYLGHNADRDASRLPTGTTATREKWVAGSPEIIVVNHQAQTYTFSWKERRSYVPDDFDTRYANLRLNVEEQVVLEISCIREDDKYGEGDWKISTHSDVQAFIEGPWVEEINRFASQVNSKDGQLRAEAAKIAKQQELESLKKKFGL